MSEHNNVDPEEIKKFDAFSKDWWDPRGHMKPLHLLNPLRLEYIKKHTELAHKKLLDVGCGGGLLSEAMARDCADVTGIDLSEDVIQVATAHAEQQRVLVHYQRQSVEHLAKTSPAVFDALTCMEMLEHVPDPSAIIQACADCVKPGGRLFFSTINRHIKAYFGAILGAEYLLGLLPKGTHEYAKFIRPSELNQWATQAELRLIDLQGVRYNPFSNIFSLTNDVSINYMACYEK